MFNNQLFFANIGLKNPLLLHEYDESKYKDVDKNDRNILYLDNEMTYIMRGKVIVNNSLDNSQPSIKYYALLKYNDETKTIGLDDYKETISSGLIYQKFRNENPNLWSDVNIDNFGQCIVELYIPDSITTIQANAFDCPNLEILIFPELTDSSITVNTNAFVNLSKLENIYFTSPDKLTIDSHAFNYSDTGSVSVHGVVRETRFNNSLKVLETFNDGININYEPENYYKAIFINEGNYAEYDISNLSETVQRSDIESLVDSSQFNYTDLISIHFPDTVNTISNDLFITDMKLTEIWISNESLIKNNESVRDIILTMNNYKYLNNNVYDGFDFWITPEGLSPTDSDAKYNVIVGKTLIYTFNNSSFTEYLNNNLIRLNKYTSNEINSIISNTNLSSSNDRYEYINLKYAKITNLSQNVMLNQNALKTLYLPQTIQSINFQRFVNLPVLENLYIYENKDGVLTLNEQAFISIGNNSVNDMNIYIEGWTNIVASASNVFRTLGRTGFNIYVHGCSEDGVQVTNASGKKFSQIANVSGNLIFD